MDQSVIEVDYLIKGAGAVGMAFADSILTHGNATMVMVDRHDRPGGHWNDAYPFVRLHQPSSTYGTNSVQLGSGVKNSAGLNAGFYELASGHEVVSHFDSVMQHRLVPSGRVHYFPMSELGDDRIIRSRVSGRRVEVRATTLVDATHSKMNIPSTSSPAYRVAAGVACLPPNDLPRVADRYRRFAVIGGGKTGMDACVWLLSHGVEPDHISWIVPRDSWVLNRANVQPGEEFFAQFCKSLADQVEAVATAQSIEDVFVALEEFGELRRIDPDVTPEAYHCAILSDGELAELRRISRVIRQGRVLAIDEQRIELEHGTLPTGPDVLHVDCSAAGIPGRPAKPVFEDGIITLQWVRTCQPTFSAAFIGFVEATLDDEQEKNRLCVPIAPPTVPNDWLRMLQTDLRNRKNWADNPQILSWLMASRLDPFVKYAITRLEADTEAATHVGRYTEHVVGAAAKIEALLNRASARG